MHEIRPVLCRAIACDFSLCSCAQLHNKTKQNKCVPSLPTLTYSHTTGCRLNVTDTQMHRNGMPHSTDWDPRAGKEGSPGSLEAWPGGKPAKPSAWGKLWWGEAQQGWNIMECHGKYMYYIYIYIYIDICWNIRQDPCYFTFFHVRLFTLCICIRFEDVSKKVSKTDDQRGCGSQIPRLFSWTFWIRVYCFFANVVGKSSWFLGKSWENPHIRCIYWCL